jgi:SAM-dependent MidA family methyltransferase
VSALDLIRTRIRDRGPITVADFMSLALYHPEHGYYARAARRTGRNGDFFTSVDVGPIFGTLLGRQFAQMWRTICEPQSAVRTPQSAAGGARSVPEPFDLVEAGASNGQLARDVLDWAAADDPEFYDAVRFHLVEGSPTARAAQAEVLAPHAAKIASSSARLPDDVHGVVYANELLDALPVHRVLMTEHGLREQYVDVAPDGRLVERAGRPSSEALQRYLDALGVGLQPGWRAEINLAALAWIARAASTLHHGFLVLIDYGHEARDLYSAAHADGTLTSFQRHLADRASERGPAWLAEPGNRDITSHVDLTSIERTAHDLGFTTLGILDQTYFLLALGLSDLSEGGGTSLAETRKRLALKTLLVPGGLGSTHKVMVFGKGVGAPPLRGLSGLRRLT